MRKILVFFALVFAFVSFASAEIIVTQQPNSVYNYGDLASVPVLVKTTAGTSGTLLMDLICNGQDTNFYKNGILLSAGEQKSIDAGAVLDSQTAGGLSSS